jgi:(2Fe-2S) ferredoxin
MAPMQAYYAMKERALNRIRETEREDLITVEVQMGICSQAAGMLDVIKAMEESILQQGMDNVELKKRGCAGFCAYEPLVVLKKRGYRPVTYCRVTPERARILLAEYVLNKRVIEAWTLNGKDVML